ncbi:SRPBCC family protein [Microcella daejeonensis]|uniref:SRPBCC family protein n=1 Tax=Microcella daejeonensis TaxID=2994971 RepID=UPI00226E6643|nr:SRPBCC family protein [Microcella daejeonensis]WAB83199.1 SRPBCC family protein [Microcella daejeonensis]
MSVTVMAMRCRPEDVFDVLADGWMFPTWVVGASRMRAVEAGWPEAGGRLHHSFGIWPALIDDVTVMREWDPPRRAVMTPAGWPLGEAVVIIEARERAGQGDGGCVVRLTEWAERGPGALVPAPLADAVLRVRNRETLRRLAFMAEGRGGTRAD